MAEPIDVEVRAGDCPCPGTPHASEHVFLAATLSLPVASAATAAYSLAEATVASQQAAVIAAYLPATIRSWSFVEQTERGVAPVAITRDNMERLLPWDRGGMEVVERADELYSEALLAPLLKRMRKLSESGPTEPLTSQSPSSGSALPEQSPPSLPDASVGTESEAPVP